MQKSFALILALATVSAFGEIVTIPSTADTGIHEISPDSSMGNARHVPAGRTASGAGTNARGLYRFNLDGQFPPNALIGEVILHIPVTLVPPTGANSATFGLHRMLQEWNEGDKSGNLGQPAEAGEATWMMRTTEPWAAPGGLAGTDYDATPSASQLVSNLGPVSFTSERLSSDVRFFAQNPTRNFGWMLRDQDETILKTAKRFGSREDSENRPLLEVHFTVPPAELRITTIRMEGSNAVIEWQGGSPAYQLQAADRVNGEWVDLLPPSGAKTASIPLTGAERYFRVLDTQPMSTAP